MQKKYALILGGSKGLGWASAQKLALNNWNLILIHRDPRNQLDPFFKKVKSLQKRGVDCISFNKDATNPEVIQSIIESLKEKHPMLKIDLLLHSIAKGTLKTMVGNNNLSASDFSISVQAMGYSLYQWVDALFKAKLLNTPCKVLAFTSEGNTKALPGYAAVSAAKGVLEAVSRNIALEFAAYGITSNCIQAGLCITEAFQKIPDSEKIAAVKEKQHPKGRLTLPEDVANAVYLLSLPEANWINGSIIKVDGGESII